MSDYKKEAALFALRLIKKGMTVGLGAGSTIAHLATALSEQKQLAASLTLVSAAQQTTSLLQQLQFKVVDAGAIAAIDIYFDGCDQLDKSLNAFKSGGGIHATEKVLASMAKDFVLLADSGKLVEALDTTYPLTLEVLPQATGKIGYTINQSFPQATSAVRMENGFPVFTVRGTMLLDVRFTKLPPLEQLNLIKMLAGVVEHSLFYRVASGAIVAGPAGVEYLY